MDNNQFSSTDGYAAVSWDNRRLSRPSGPSRYNNILFIILSYSVTVIKACIGSQRSAMVRGGGAGEKGSVNKVSGI